MRAASLALLILLIALVLFGPNGGSVRAQAGSQLDQPLLAANMCGAGDPGDQQFTIAATGDTFPHENIQAVGEAQGYDYLFDYLRPFLKAADLAYTNFDGAMLEGSPYTGYPAFNYNPKLAAALHNAGIGVVSTANNHIMDRGPEGLDATLAVLQAAGIQQHGSVPSSAASQPRPAFLPLVLSRGGASIKVAFLSFSWGTNGIPDPYNQVNLLWQSNEYGQQGGIRQSVLDAVAEARRAADLVIVAAHWGYEYQFYPDAAQVEGARQLAAAGADIILGAQPHTLQPVDVLDTNGRKTLVIYSLANFLASQGAFQVPSYSATSVVFYIGVIRGADGHVQVSGYRYLPTMHVDGDTRPAPIPRAVYHDVIAHVRAEMRDPGGARQLSPEPPAPGAHVEVCPSYTLPSAPDQPIGGDFAQYLATLGGPSPRAPEEAAAVFGTPLGPAKAALTGDCQTTTIVLTTEHQRLEWHPDLDWPYRISGTQLGIAIYRYKYPGQPVAPRTNLGGDAIADPRFQAFFGAYGGLPIFGYPISPLLLEPGERGQPITVEYFERARFEAVPGAPADAGLLQQVRLGALGREYAKLGACPQAAATATALSAASAPLAATAQPARAMQTAQPLASAQLTRPEIAASARPWWFGALLAVLCLGLVGTIVWGLRIRASMPRRIVRPARRARRAPLDDDALLRRLLDQE